jgi:hypothetical protein
MNSVWIGRIGIRVGDAAHAAGSLRQSGSSHRRVARGMGFTHARGIGRCPSSKGQFLFLSPVPNPNRPIRNPFVTPSPDN